MPFDIQAESIVTTGCHQLSKWALITHYCIHRYPNISAMVPHHHRQMPEPAFPSLQYTIKAPISLSEIRHMTSMPYRKGKYDLLRSPKKYAPWVLLACNVRLIYAKSKSPHDTTPQFQAMTVSVMDPYRRFIDPHSNFHSPHIPHLSIIFGASTDPAGVLTPSTTSRARKEFRDLD